MGLTYLFITHDLSVAWVIADRIAVMYLGRIVEIGSAEEVIRRPGHPYTQALVSVMPSPEPPEIGRRAKRQILAGETPDAAHDPDRLPVPPALPAGRPGPGSWSAAARRNRPCSTWATATPLPAGWPRVGARLAGPRRRQPRRPGAGASSAFPRCRPA